MPKMVIADTSVLIVFQKIEEFELLQKVYGGLVTTPEILKEFGEALPAWVKVKSVSDQKYQELLSAQIDLGEASAIALAVEYEDVLLVLDDLKARKLASQSKIKLPEHLV